MRRSKCGYQRYQCRYDIRAALMKRGMNMSRVAREIGVSAELVSSTVLGKKHCPQVLDALKKFGVPDEFLFDPRKNINAA